MHTYNYLCFTGQSKSYCCIFPATIRNAGCYYCQVKNHYGAVNSSIATLMVTTSSTARKPSVASGFCYIPSIMENSASDKGLIMLKTQGLES